MISGCQQVDKSIELTADQLFLVIRSNLRQLILIVSKEQAKLDRPPGASS
jgi:hypothetical protein